MSEYLGCDGLTLDVYSGLASIARVAFFEKLPRGWAEVRDPRPESEGGRGGLMYQHIRTGRVGIQHPHDGFYRRLLRVELNRLPEECPFVTDVMKFTTGSTPADRRDYYYSFRDRSVESVPPEDKSRLFSEEGAKALIARDGEIVRRNAVMAIMRTYRLHRLRLKIRRAWRVEQIMNGIYARKLQRAWRRKLRRILLKRWDRHRMMKKGFKLWHKKSQSSDNYFFRIRVARARRRVREADDRTHAVVMVGDREDLIGANSRAVLTEQEQKCLERSASLLNQLDDRLSARGLNEAEWEGNDAVRAQQRFVEDQKAAKLRQRIAIVEAVMDSANANNPKPKQFEVKCKLVGTEDMIAKLYCWPEDTFGHLGGLLEQLWGIPFAEILLMSDKEGQPYRRFHDEKTLGSCNIDGDSLVHVARNH